MNKKLTNYLNQIDQLLTQKEVKNSKQVLNDHLQQIQFYQHERLVHFLVTGLFAILTTLCFIGAIALMHLGLLVLFFIFICLLIPYIFYYYTLENGVQKMYDQYWELKMKSNKL